MKIESVDLFYLSMPEITTEADGSQDALLVRVAAGGHVGWGECEASPLASIAAFVAPMSHGVCRPVGEAVLGRILDGPESIARMAAEVEYSSMDLLQAPHTWSGVEMALWDALGRARGEPVWRLLGYERSHPRTPYASQLFGDTPQDTLNAGRRARCDGFRAVKFGWGPIGRGSVRDDAEHFQAAREGLDDDGILLVDAGQIWNRDVEAAAARLPALEAAGAVWLEEPFHASALEAYGELARRSSRVKLAGGEGAHNAFMAEHLIRYGGVGFVQIDCGRIGGIGPAKRVAGYAAAQGVTYVNHTFTSHLALSASLQPYAGLAGHDICEFPFAPKPLSRDLVTNPLVRDGNGQVAAPDAPGLGVATSDSAGAALFEVWMTKHLGRTLVAKAVPEPARAAIGTSDVAAVVAVLENPGTVLGPDPGAVRDAILLESLAAALGEVRQKLGADPAAWNWGKLHHAQFDHALAPLADEPTRAQMGVRRLAMGGSAFSPRAASYRPSDFRVIAGASFRMVLDVGNWDGSVVVNAPGQSGDPFSPHYRDLAPLWAAGEYVPLLYSREAVERGARSVIRLTPQ